MRKGAAHGQSSSKALGATHFIARLKAAYDPQLSAEALAQRLHISQRTLQRRIQQHFQCTPHEWMHHEKMIFALKKLRQKELKISEISYLCGYQHVSSFTQAFRQYFDNTPAEI